MTDEMLRTLRLLEQCETNCHIPSGDLGAFMGWADAMVELQLMSEENARGSEL